MVFDKNGTYLAGDSFTVSSAYFYNEGLVFYKNKLYIVSMPSSKIVVYNLDGTRSASDDVDLEPILDVSGSGITFSNNKFWILDSNKKRVIVYNLDGTRSASDDMDLSLHPLGHFTGIASGHNKLWILDSNKNKVIVYNLDGTRSASDDFDLDLKGYPKDTHIVGGLKFVNNKFWVLYGHLKASVRVYQFYNFASSTLIGKYNIYSFIVELQRMFLRIHDRQRPIPLEALD